MPTDFQRYTKDGLVRLVSENGFRVESINGLFTVYHTLYWAGSYLAAFEKESELSPVVAGATFKDLL